MKKKINVLVVEDEEFSIDILQEYCEEAKINTYIARDGLEALKILEEGQPINVVILDRMMPVMDGIQFLKRIKSDNRYQDIPVIMQSAASSSYQVVEAIKEGILYYLVKPYSKEKLISLIKVANDKYKNQRK